MATPDARVTAGAVYPRAMQTFGYFSVGEANGTPVYSMWDYDDNINPLTTKYGQWVPWCKDRNTWCDVATSCGGGSIYYEPDASKASESCTRDWHCMTETMYESLGAPEPLMSKVFCVKTTILPKTFYREKPEQPRSASASATTNMATEAPSTSASSTSNTLVPPINAPSRSDILAPLNTDIPSSNAESSPSNDNTRTGIIAGSVVGGVVLLGLMALLALYIIRRTRKRNVDQAMVPPEKEPTLYYTHHAPGYEHHEFDGTSPPVELGTGMRTELPAEPASGPNHAQKPY